MRIGINASFLRKPGTGIGQVSTHFLREMVKLQSTNSKYQNVEYFLYCEEEPTFDFSLPVNFTVKTFLPFWKRDDLIRKVLWEKNVAREAKKDGCDVFISLYQSSTVVSGMRHVMVVHDLIPRLFPEYQGNIRQRFHWRLVEQALLRADRIVAVSAATRNDLVEFGVDPERIIVGFPDTALVFRQPVTLEEENRVMTTYALTPGYIYHGGGLEIRKNTKGLLLAYQLLVEKEKRGELGVIVPPLVISGRIFAESNPLATPVRRLVEELGLGERVKLLDFVPEADLPVLYKNALFFAYPSLYEGFGLPVLEALRMKTPVLVSDVASLPEVAGDAAVYINPEQVESIASGMERLLKDATLRQSLREAADKAGARFSWGTFVDVVLDASSLSSKS